MTCEIYRQEFKAVQNTSGKHQDTDVTGRKQAHQERTAVVRGSFLNTHRDKSNSNSLGCALSGLSGGLLGGRVVSREHDSNMEHDTSEEIATKTHCEQGALYNPFLVGGENRVSLFYTPYEEGLCVRTHRGAVTFQNNYLYSVPPRERVYKNNQRGGFVEAQS